MPAIGGSTVTLGAGSFGFTLQNAKNGGYLSPATQPTNHTPVTTTDGQWTWGVSH
jgi:hypothetical protein